MLNPSLRSGHAPFRFLSEATAHRRPTVMLNEVKHRAEASLHANVSPHSTRRSPRNHCEGFGSSNW